MPTIRLARPEEAEPLVALENEASHAFADVEGYEWVDALPAMAIEEVSRAIADRGVWVVDDEGTIAGAVVCWWHGDDCHLRELNVRTTHARRGLGRQLVGTVIEAARDRGCKRVVLTTFAEVPFNGPWYARLGFVVLDPPDGWVAKEREDEAREGLDRKPRQAMVYALSS
ncbi:MAG: GNAT family N-acetyltransferase [Polyangiaceae bacterium]